MKRNSTESRRQKLLAILVAAMALTFSVFMVACSDGAGETAKEETKTTAAQQAEAKEAAEASSEKEETGEPTQSEAEESTQPAQTSTRAKTEEKDSAKESAKAKTKDKTSTKETGKSAKEPTKAKTEDKSSTKETTKPTEKKAQVCYISIDGYCSDKEIALQSGDTVYDILKRSGATVSARNTGYGLYIEAINGLAEFDKGPTSGWKYSVNGADPGYGCDSYSVKQGDRISWYYVLEP